MHRIDGPGATVDNRFTDGDPVGGVQATVVTDDWANDVQEELMSILTAGGVTPVKGTQDQVLSALTTLIRGQGLNAFTTAGTSPAFTLTPSPAITAYAVNQRFSVKFNAAAPTSGTLDVSGKGPKNLKQYDSTGAKIATVIGENLITDVVYDGTDMVVLDPLPAVAGNLIGIQGSAKNLIGSATGLSSIVTYTADEIIVESAANTYQVLRAVSISPSVAASGVNGLDTGASAVNTWYSVWVIWNGTTKAGLLSLSATAPTLPSGYTHCARVGWMRTDGTANKYPLSFKQLNRCVQYVLAAGSNVTQMPVMASGATGGVVAVAVGAFVPSTAVVIYGTVYSVPTAAANYVQVAPNPNYVSTLGLPGMPVTGGGVSGLAQALQFRFVLESTNIYWLGGTNAGGTLQASGWEDNL